MASETWHCTLNKNDIDNIMQGLYSILVSKDVRVQLEASNYSSSISTYFLFFFGRLNVYPFPNVPQWTLFWLKVNKLYLTCKSPSPSNRTKRNRLSGEFWREGLYYSRSFWCTSIWYLIPFHSKDENDFFLAFCSTTGTQIYISDVGWDHKDMK